MTTMTMKTTITTTTTTRMMTTTTITAVPAKKRQNQEILIRPLDTFAGHADEASKDRFVTPCPQLTPSRRHRAMDSKTILSRPLTVARIRSKTSRGRFRAREGERGEARRDDNDDDDDDR